MCRHTSYSSYTQLQDLKVAIEMVTSSYLLVFYSVCFVLVHSFDIDESNRKSFYDHFVLDIDGNEVSLEKYKGKVRILFHNFDYNSAMTLIRSTETVLYWFYK